MAEHWDVRLGAEILHNHFLNMAILLVQRADREQRIDAFLRSLANANQNSRRERHRKFSSFFDGAQAERWNLVRRFSMRKTIAHEPWACVFEHQPDAGI